MEKHEFVSAPWHTLGIRFLAISQLRVDSVAIHVVVPLGFILCFCLTEWIASGSEPSGMREILERICKITKGWSRENAPTKMPRTKESPKNGATQQERTNNSPNLPNSPKQKTCQ